MAGWISLHRSIEDHWMFQEKRTFSKFEAWVALLLMANHKDGKTTIGNQLIEVKRGQRITSVKQLSENWSWSRTKVKAYLDMLKDDGMIDIKTTTKYTLVTIANYDFYQSDEGRKSTQKDINQTSNEHQKDINQTSDKHQKDTNNNDNNDNNELIMTNNDNNNQSVVGVIFDKYTELGFGAINAFKAEQINEHLNTFEPEVIIKSLEVASNNNKATMNYVNGILNNWKQRGLTTLEKVEAEEKKKQLEQMKPTYQQRRREMPGEKAPDWIEKAKERPEGKSSEPVKTAADDPEIQKMIADFRNTNN